MTQSILAQGVNSGCNSQISVEFGQNYCNKFVIVLFTVVLTKLQVFRADSQNHGPPDDCCQPVSGRAGGAPWRPGWWRPVEAGLVEPRGGRGRCRWSGFIREERRDFVWETYGGGLLVFCRSAGAALS